MFVTDALNYFSGGYLFQEKSYTSGETLIKELSQYSPCRALIEEAQNVIQEQRLDALKVCFEPTKSGFDAEKEFNVIRIRPGMSAPKQRDRFIFELTNVIQHKKFMETWESAIKGVYKNPEEYARAAEFIEFTGLKRRNIVSKVMNKEKGRFFRPYFENPWEGIPIEHMEFDRYYSSYLSNNHKEHYRKGWRRVNKSYFDCYYSSYLSNNHKEHYRKDWRRDNKSYNGDSASNKRTSDHASSKRFSFNNILKIANVCYIKKLSNSFFSFNLNFTVMGICNLLQSKVLNASKRPHFLISPTSTHK
jgi:hypothetical protein